jgi:hypothetical protein
MRCPSKKLTSTFSRIDIVGFGGWLSPCAPTGSTDGGTPTGELLYKVYRFINYQGQKLKRTGSKTKCSVLTVRGVTTTDG